MVKLRSVNVTFQRRKRLGLCRDCGGLACRLRCESCIERNRTYMRNRRRNLRSRGLCLRCENPSKTQFCEDCKRELKNKF